jgi:hypothetical protein
MKRIYLFSFLFLTLLWSCANESTSDQSETEATETSTEEAEIEEGPEEGWVGLALLNGGYKLGIEVPGEDLAQGKSEAIYHENTGELEVKAGGNFDLFILEDESQMEMVKNELNNHPFYNIMYEVANDSTLLYQQITKTGDKTQWQIYVERNLGNTTLLIRSNEAIPFTEYQAKLMLRSALSVTPL